MRYVQSGCFGLYFELRPLTSENMFYSSGVPCQDHSSSCCKLELLCKRSAKEIQNSYSKKEQAWTSKTTASEHKEHQILVSAPNEAPITPNNSWSKVIWNSLTHLSPQRLLLIVESRAKSSLAYFLPHSIYTFCFCISQWEIKEDSGGWRHTARK